MGEDWNTRISLINRAKDGDDEAAWEEFVSIYHGYIFMILKHMRITSVDLEDLTQEVLVKIWKNLPKFDEKDNRARFRTWLSTLIRNQALDAIKMAKRYKKRVDKAQEEGMIKSINECELEAIIDSEWGQHILKVALGNIRDVFSEQAIFVFEESVKGVTEQELAEKLGIKINSVNKLKNRVKKRMIEEVKSLREHVGI
ncbi:MAG: RNA polymerase sigma factor [Planctomycetes bacterium]|nr:RNA polymerase sigma factor [Planctomycetota bacterium]